MKSSIKNIFRKTLFLGLPSALLVVLAVTYWLLHTASGAAWLWNQVQDAAPGAVSSSRVEGNLASGFAILDLQYRSDSVDVSVNRLELQATPGWWPVSVQIRTLALRDVNIATHASAQAVQDPNDETDIRDILGSLNLPVPLRVHDAEIVDIRLQTDDDPQVMLIESLRFQATLDGQLQVDQFHVQAMGADASLQAHLLLESPFELVATVTGHYPLNRGAATQPLDLPFLLELSGNLEKLQFSLASGPNGLTLSGELMEPVNGPAWDIKGGLEQLRWPLDNSDEILMISGLTLVSQGQFSDWTFALDTGIEAGALQNASLAVSGSGTENGMQISSATLTGPGVDLGVNGKLDWSQQFEAGFNAVIGQLDLSPWLEEWPEGAAIAGNLDLNWSESRLEIPRGNLTVSGTDLAVNIEADIDVDANRVNGQLDWSGFSWPLANETADFSSPSGSLKVSGSMDHWETAGRVELQTGDYPNGSFEIQGEGGRTSTRLTILNGAVLGGHINGVAEADWQSGLNWSAGIRLLGIDTAPLLPDWPGRLDAELAISAQSQPQRTQIDVTSVQGVVSGIQISARGGLTIEPDNLAFRHFELRTDDAVLLIDGATMDPAGASVKFNGYLPSALLQGARGNVELDARYSSKASSPLLALNLKALDLAWEGFNIKTLSVSAAETAASATLPALQVDAAGLAYEDILLDDLALALSPAGDKYSVRASLSSESLSLDSSLMLTPQSTDDLLGGPWHGVLDELQMSVAQTYDFKLLKPASIEWSSGSAKLGPVCLSETGNAGLCLDGSFESNGGWSLIADASDIPLDYLRDFLGLDVHFEQMIEGHMEWHQVSGGTPSGGAEFRISAGRILDTDENELLAESSDGKFGFVLQNGNLESGVLDIKFPGTGFIDLQFEVLNIIEHGTQKLNGRALTRLDDIRFIGQLVLPGLDDISGSFESTIQLGGTLDDPTFDGGFSLSDGLIRYAPIGMKIEDIDIEGQLERRDQGSFKGRFRAGEGIGSIAGNLLYKNMDELQMSVSVSGDQLLVIDTDALKILTNTDLQLGLSQQRVDINGHIMIPSARLTPANLLLESVNDSEDLIIESNVQAGKDEKVPANQFYGQLEVAFGDDVFIKVPGIETHISGSVLFDWSGDQIPLAEGSYELHGKVDVYGPILEIDNGHISFPKVPANNPLLNIKAGREIFGNTQIRSAGVQLIGTLKRPVLEAYTVPVTNEERAWTLLVTGSDFDQAQGVGGFDVGTYIAPRLYVSYGISLFQEDNVISARYDLKKGFGVKVTSGQRETGLDVSYTIDR